MSEIKTVASEEDREEIARRFWGVACTLNGTKRATEMLRANPWLMRIPLDDGASEEKHFVHALLANSTIELLEVAIDMGAPLEVRDVMGRTILHEIVRMPNPPGKDEALRWSLIRRLEAAGARFDARDNAGLPIWASGIPLDRLQYVVERGAPVDNLAEDNESGVSVALRTWPPVKDDEMIAVLECLIKHGARIHQEDVMKIHKLPIAKASVSGRMGVFEFLIDRGARVDVTDAQGRNILHLGPQPEAVRRLVDLGVDPNHMDNFRRTPSMHLLAASLKKRGDGVNQDTLIAMAAAGADLNLRDEAQDPQGFHDLVRHHKDWFPKLLVALNSMEARKAAIDVIDEIDLERNGPGALQL